MARGVDGVITLVGATVVIRHTGADRIRRFIAGQRVMEERIAIADLREVHLAPATFWTNGHIRLETRGDNAGNTGKPTGRFSAAKNAVSDPSSILFKRRRQPEFEMLQRQIRALIESVG